MEMLENLAGFPHSHTPTLTPYPSPAFSITHKIVLYGLVPYRGLRLSMKFFPILPYLIFLLPIRGA
jgi:hypothetical protein